MDVAWLPEYEALANGVGVSALTGRSRIAVRGNDRVRFLHSFCTNDIQRLSPGQGCEAFVTNHQGKTVGHIFVFCTAEALLLDAVTGAAAGLIAHLDRFVISDDVSFEDLSAATCELLVAGPKVRELLAKAIAGEVPAQKWDHCQTSIADQNVGLALIDYLVPESFLISTDAGRQGIVHDGLVQQGAISCGSEAVESLRLESGTPLFGHEVTPENLPQEIGRDRQAISFTKGCYLGQETIARIDAMGHVNRLLAGVCWLNAETPIPPPGTELKVNDKVVGQVTSAAWSPRLKRPLALAHLRRGQAAPGTLLDSPQGPAEVVPLPLAPLAPSASS